MSNIEYFGSSDLLFLLNLMATEYAKYVKKVQGKDLSTNDFTDALLTKLNGIAVGAEVNVQSDFSQSDSSADDFIKNKPTLGTAAAMDVTNSYSASGTAPVSGQAVAQAIASVTGISFESYNSFADLPAVGQTGVIYLVPNGGSAPNVKDEYFWNTTTQAYELFGTTQIDLSNYVQKSELVAMTQAEVEAAWNSVFGS